MGQRPKLLSFVGPADRHFQNPDRLRPLFVGGASGEDDDDDDGTDGATVPIGRYLKLKGRMQAADRRASTAEAKIAELEPVAAKVQELEKQVEADAESIKKLRIDNAFLTSDVKWVDAEAALRLVDLSEVEIKDDGTVKGLKEALAALAEKKPYLVQKEEDEGKGKKGKKKKASDADEDEEDESDEDEESEDEDGEDEDEDDDEEGTSGAGGRKLSSVQGGASGTSTGSGKRKRKSKGPTDDELMRRYRI